MQGKPLNRAHVRHLLARISLAFVFISIGIWEIVQPSYWGMYVPPFFSAIIATNTFVMIHGMALVLIGTAVLLGIYLRVASALAVLVMLTIVASLTFYFGFNDIVIRDIAILLIAASLFFDDTEYLRVKIGR